MSNAGKGPPPGNEWFEAQRRYWDAWASLYQQRPSTGPRSAEAPPLWPWAEGLEAWWKAMAPAAPQAQDLSAKLIDQGKVFLHASEEFTRFLLGASATLRETSSWQDELAARFADLRSAFLHPSADPAESIRGLMAFWELPLDTWRRTVSSMSVLPGDLVGSFKPDGWAGVADRWHDHFDRFLSVPALGYTRESQEQWQELGRLWLDYQRALQAYTGAFGRLGLDALDRWYRMIREQMEARREIGSLRQLYDLWVDAGEEAYNALVTTDEYAKLYGDLVNTLMALKLRGRMMVDEAAGALGMPTSRGMATVQRRQQDLIRELRRLRQEVEQMHAARGNPAEAPPPATDDRAAASPRAGAPGTTKRKSRRTKPAKNRR